MFRRTRASVSLPSVSASGIARSIFMRATSSLGIARSFSPAASSVVSISERAVDTQASSGRPARFLNPRTAIDWRGARAAADGPPPGARRDRTREARNAARAARTMPAATPAIFRRRRRSVAGPATTVSPRSARTTSPAEGKRSAGERSRQRRIVFSQTGGRSGARRRGDGAASFSFFRATESGVSPSKGCSPVTIS